MSQLTHTTQRLKATPEDIARAAEILRNGGTVAFPTETVYGLGANALDTNAVASIFAAKQRPHWDPIIVHVSDRAMLDQVAIVPPQAEPLIAAFWPGPLTLLLPRTASVPDNVTAGRPLVGVRMPAHPVALALIEAAGLPYSRPQCQSFRPHQPHHCPTRPRRSRPTHRRRPRRRPHRRRRRIHCHRSQHGSRPGRRHPLSPRSHHLRHARTNCRSSHPLPATATTHNRTTKSPLARRRASATTPHAPAWSSSTPNPISTTSSSR